MSRHRSFVITSYLMLFLCLLFTQRVAVAQGFTLTRLASENDQLPNVFLTIPTINNLGTVAYQQSVQFQGVRQPIIFISDGVTTTPFFNYADFGLGGSPTIVLNDNGAIGAETNVLNTGFPVVRRIIRINPDATVMTLATTLGSDFTSFDFSIDMNNLGQIAVKARHTDGTDRILLLDDSGIFEIARSSASLINLGAPSINDDGVVAFKAQEPLLGQSLFTGTVGGLVIKAGTPPGGTGSTARQPLINNSGSVLGDGGRPAVLYTAQADSGDINVDVLITGFEDPTVLRQLRSGYSYNNLGDFVVVTSGGGAASDFGAFVGNDPTRDTVVRGGDMVFGGGVTDIRMGQASLNDLGQVVFLMQTGSRQNPSDPAVSHVVLAIPIVGIPDADNDDIPDVIDNCIDDANADQRDTDGDGHGNRCDGDLNNDCNVNPIDLGIFRSVFFSADADGDLNGDGIVNPIDLGIFRSLFFQTPGPSPGGSLCNP